MSEAGKRKGPPGGAAPDSKRKKGANNNRWKTPHQDKVKALQVQRGSVEPGDVGIWVTCARGMEGKAAREMQMLFDEYAEKMYGIQSSDEVWSKAAGAAAGKTREGPENGGAEVVAAGGGGGGGGEDDDDIESLVRREVAALKSTAPDKDRVFTRIRLSVECLLFTKTAPPVDPVALARRISEDAKRDAEAAAAAEAAGAAGSSTSPAGTDGPAPPVARTCRYLNRLTPITASGRANEKGVQEVARAVLAPWFKLVAAPQPAADEAAGGAEGSKGSEAAAAAGLAQGEGSVEEKPGYKFAIRATVRHNNELRRQDVIHSVAGLIDQSHHKVDLEKPDKFILVDIFKYTCGMSVVGGDWNDLRKYNLSELYNLQHKSKQAQDKPEAPGEATEAAQAGARQEGAADAKDGDGKQGGGQAGSEKGETAQAAA